MKKIFLFSLFFISLLGNLSAQRVDVEELKKHIKGNIHFINYTGPERIVQKREEIINIGKILAIRLARNGREGHISLKYSVYHIIGPAKEKGLDADIISIDRDARVDHIKNVRRIIGGYLAEAYGYSNLDASTLAVFITLYNAVYRGNIAYFAGRYKKEVVSYLNKENAGISLRYYEWPGKTRLVIPLSPEAKKGEISSISTSEVSTKAVVEAARKTEGKELKARKGLVSIKEREVEQKRERIAAIEKKTEELEKQKAKLEETIEKKTRELEEKRGKGNLSKAEITESEREIEALKREKKEREEEIARLNASGSSLKKEVAKKEREIKEEREAIAEDQAKLKGKEKVSGGAVEERGVISRKEPLYFLYREKKGEGMYRLVVMDFKNTRVERESDIKMIVDRNVTFWANSIVVKAFDNSSPLDRERGLLSIFLIKPATLSTLANSKPIVWKNSRILRFKDRIYAIGFKDGSFKLIAFDSNLHISAFSRINVERDSYFCSYNNLIVVQDVEGKVRLLNPDTLK